jgi:hypothetical protein
MAYTTNSGRTSGSSEGQPILIPVSSTGNSSSKVLQIQSYYPFIYTISSSIGGQQIVQFSTPDGAGLKTASVDLSPYVPSYPFFATVDMADAASLRSLNTQQVTLTGGDIFKLELIFPYYNPSADGYSMYGVDGAHVLLKNSNLRKQINQTGEVHYLPQG